MAKQRYINTHFWDDTFVVDLDPIEKLVFLYFLTNPLTNLAGVYEVSLRRVAFDTGIDKDMIVKILARFEAANKMIYRDGWIMITNFIKNQSLNPKTVKGIEEIVKCCPDWIKDRLSIAYQSLSHLNRDGDRDGDRDTTGDSHAPNPHAEAAAFEADDPNEEQEDYLTRKQKEFPKLDVRKVFHRYVGFCRDKNLSPKRKFFNKWLETEEQPMTAPFESSAGFVNPHTGRGLK